MDPTIFFVIWIILILISMSLASSKNKNIVLAILISMLIPIPAILYYMFCKKSTDLSNEIQCPKCGNKFIPKTEEPVEQSEINLSEEEEYNLDDLYKTQKKEKAEKKNKVKKKKK